MSSNQKYKKLHKNRPVFVQFYKSLTIIFSLLCELGTSVESLDISGDQLMPSLGKDFVKR